MSIDLIVNLVSYGLLAIVLLFGFWVGFWRGIKRSSINLAISFVVTVIAFLITAPISKLILTINVNGAPLSSLIIDMVKDIGGIAETAIENSTALANFLQALPLFVMNIVVFLVLYWIMRFLGYIIYVIVMACLPKKVKEKPNKVSRLTGAGLGVVKSLIFIFLFMSPITALTNFAGSLKDNIEPLYTASTQNPEQNESSTLSSQLNDVLSDDITSAINTFNHSGLGVLGSLGGLDKVVFDGLTKVDAGGTDFNFRTESVAYLQVVNTVLAVTDDQGEDASLKNIKWDKFDADVQVILNGGIVKGLGANLFKDFLNNYGKFFTSASQEEADLAKKIVDNINTKSINEYFSSDLKKIYSSVSSLAKVGLLDDVLFGEFNQDALLDSFLASDVRSNVINSIETLLSMNILHDAINPIVEFAATKIDAYQINSSSSNIAEFNAFKTKLTNIIKNLMEVNDVEKVSNIINDPTVLLKDDSQDEETKASKLLTILGKVLDDVDSIGIFEKDGKTLLDRIIEDIASKNNDFALSNLTKINGAKASYSSLMEEIKKPVDRLVKLNIFDDIKDTDKIIEKISNTLDSESKDGKYSTLLSDLILPLYKLDVVRDNLNIITDKVNIIDLDSLKVYNNDKNHTFNYEASYKNVESDLNYITKLLVDINKINLKGENTTIFDALVKDGKAFKDLISLLPDNIASKILPPALYALSLRGLTEQILGVLEENLTIITGESVTFDLDSITLKEAAPEDQASEIAEIMDKLLGLLENGANLESIESIPFAKLGILLDAIKVNAYRKELSKKTEDGLFRSAFISLYDSMKTEYSEAEKIIGNKQPYEINFAGLLKTVDEIQNAAEGSFGDKLGGIIDDLNNGNEVSKDTVDSMLETLDDNKEQVEEMLDTLKDLDLEVEFTVTDEQKSELEQKIENSQLSDEAKETLKDILGLLQAGGEGM